MKKGICLFVIPRAALWPAMLEGQELGNKMQGRWGPPTSPPIHPSTCSPPPPSQWGGKWCVKHGGATHSIKQRHEGEEILPGKKKTEMTSCYSPFSDTVPVVLWLWAPQPGTMMNLPTNLSAELKSTAKYSWSKIHHCYKMDTRMALLSHHLWKLSWQHPLYTQSLNAVISNFQLSLRRHVVLLKDPTV